MNALEEKKLVMIGIRKRGQWGFRYKSQFIDQNKSSLRDPKKLKAHLYQELKSN
ncbi:MAG: hypothetical protein HOD92_07745 [Deltaproteobacteria bacterium]|jgi:hypothetical protein|nr:hypothetical protein [Deltaproteobacteria bacterium]MBT4526074.1 hypothetical protein [Deltaproteobacteria bacterium]